MLNVFSLAHGRLVQEEIESLDALAHVQPVWVDLDAPTPEEKGWIAKHFGVTIPDDAVDDDLEESARFYEEDNGELHIRSDFLIDDDENPRNVRVAFILFRNVLFSIHDEELPVFRLLRLRARRIPALIEDAKDVLLKLYDADAEYSADSLDSHTTFLFDKINFLMNATVGFININQNQIIKLFSVASVGLLPPTLIASIYGMNFEFMPELRWPYGYPFAIGLMVASVVVPFLYFRRKGWL